PDFLVLFKNGKLGIFDTKASGDREDINKLKAEGLYKYIIEESMRGKQLFGGLVIKKGSHFMLNMNESYKPYKSHSSTPAVEETIKDWIYLDEYLNQIQDRK
ncbi:MAG: hypothetical protein L6407_05085, partial [Candidatus Delongbacteria bacterium]|nr:hypothetical protein [Candidatus Delongbacteria bacterium]